MSFGGGTNEWECDREFFVVVCYKGHTYRGVIKFSQTKTEGEDQSSIGGDDHDHVSIPRIYIFRRRSLTIIFFFLQNPDRGEMTTSR